MPIEVPAPTPTTTITPGDWTGTINGLAFGFGTSYNLAGVTGWKQIVGAPLGGAMANTSSVLPSPKMSQNGAWPIPYWMATRNVTLLLDITSNVVEFSAAVAALEAATQPTGNGLATITLQIDGVATTIYGALTARDIPTDLEYQFGLSQATLEWEAPDPRRFGTPVVEQTALPYVSGGLTFPITFPITFDATEDAGTISPVNVGTTNGPLTLTVTGPCTGPRITNQDLSLSIEFSSSLVLQADDVLVIDTEAQSCILNGTASRNGYLTQRGWFDFQVGANDLAFSAASYSSGALLTVTGTPAWI